MKVLSLKWAAALVALQTMFGTAAYAAAPANSMFSDTSKVSGDKMAAIQEAVRQGLLSGDPQGTFRPSATLTRQELAVLLTRALKLEPVMSSSSSFKDVHSIQFAAPYIEAAQKAGLLSGDGLGNFRPNDPVTREELAAVFVRAVGGTDAKGSSTIVPQDQSSISQWAAGSVNTALRLGLIDTPDSRLNPRGEVRREDIAPFLIDIFKTQEQSAVIDDVDGDIVTINHVPYLVEGALKALIGNTNQEALKGAVLKFNSRNRNVDGLKELEIVQKNVVIHTAGLPDNSVLRVSGDGVQVKGDVNGTLDLKKGVSSIQVNGSIKHLTVSTDSPLFIKGNGVIQKLELADNAKITLNPEFKVEKVQVPNHVTVSQVIQNYNEIQKQIGQVQDADGKVQEPSEGTTVNSGTPSVSGGTAPSIPVPNYEPSVITEISDITLNATDYTQKINLANVFTDRDGDRLTFTASSSDTHIVQVITGNTNGKELSVIPVNRGSAVITVKADDGHGHSKEITFSVTVQPVLPAENHVPTVKNELPAVNAEVTDGAQNINLSNVFKDEDGDALTYTAVSSAAGVAAVSVNGSELTLTPVNAGTATITVTADDGKGGTQSAHFTFTVTSPPAVNHAPVVIDTIKDVSVEAGAVDKTIDLNSIFADEDQDTLTYSAASSDPGVAATAVTGNQLSISPLTAGTVTITVTANDGHGGSVPTTFQVTVGEKRGLFISELAWGSSDNTMQIIELYHAGSEVLDASKIRIERSDGGDPIQISPDAGDYISGGSTYTIGETMYFGEVVPTYNTDMGFYNEENPNPVTLSLYYDGQLVDTAVFKPHTTLARNSSVIHGRTNYEESEWVDEGADYTDGLNSFNEAP
ncbi:S-layer homology domain-containing protein [Paenibacillus sp. JX-17]|uniref:S-layer homology domain-containing protein n=1 Tax=Paenibacillus lacisoli TaxID=3064525 RepID=A0ABT9CEJ1_9BACL|nr:S-layer homology domain-containing protein [Paenibacillus sp. JX-17]MDO7907697.1 S-layer homology domain-containing protein [Paenibacillus sp. JX-17]